MIITRKYTFGDGDVRYVEEEIEELDEDITLEDALAKLRELGVEI